MESFLGVVLPVAAALKAQQFRWRPDSPYAILVIAEICLAMWLLTGGLARTRWIAATGCFLIFFIVAAFEAVHGKPSCGCFGNVKIPPTATAGFDLCAVAALGLARPRVQAAKGVVPGGWIALGVALVAMILAAVWTAHLFESAPAAGEVIVLEPDEWIGKPFPFFDEIEG